MKVRIPFLARFREPLLSGQKIWTSRSRWYGNIGDTFPAFGETFIILDRTKMPLDNVANHFVEEGCESREDFIKLWKQIHPYRGFIPKQMVYVHIFKKIGGE